MVEAEKNDEVAAAQAEVEKTAEAYKAAQVALNNSLTELKYTARKALEEAAPDEWEALAAAWNALDNAVYDAMNERALLASHFANLGFDGFEPVFIYEKFAPEEYEAWSDMGNWGGSEELAFEIAVAESVESLIVAAKLKLVMPDEWAAYETAHATLKEKAPAECAAYEAALAQWILRCRRDELTRKLEQRASGVRDAYHALLDVEWHVKWAEQLAHVASEFHHEGDDYDLPCAIAALAAMFQAFESAQKTENSILRVPMPYKTVKAMKKAFFAVHKAFRKILSLKGNEWSEWYDILIECKSEADKDRQERKASS